jgi:hypothetical protein
MLGNPYNELSTNSTRHSGTLSGLEKLVTKAKRLIVDRRVTRIEYGTFQVVGDHGTYIVVKGADNAYHCGCQGYLNKGFCSHALAVTLLTSRTRTRRGAVIRAEGQQIPPEVPIERIRMLLSDKEKLGEDSEANETDEE